VSHASPVRALLVFILAGALGAAAAVTPGLARAQEREPDARELGRDEAARLSARFVSVAAEATPKTVCVFGVIGLGSGAVVDSSGTVVTNAHVAAGARYAVILRHDGRRVLYRRVGIDYEKDLAVLDPVEPEAAPLPHFKVVVERPAEGTFLCALGFPGGPRGADPSPTFTVGRALGRSARGPTVGILDYSDAIRTDVPIFSGNSGGPLVDAEGRLVGINGAVNFGDEKGGVDSFAVPCELVADRLETLRGGVVRLPGGRTLDPESNPLLKVLEDRLDPIVRRMMDERLKTPAPRGEGGRAPAGAAPAEAAGAPEAADAFVKRTRTSPRNRALAAAFRGVGAAARRRPVVSLADDAGRKGLGTAISATDVVACASAFGPGDRLSDEAGRRFRVVGRAPAHDLLLASLETGEPLPTSALAAARPVGTVVAVVGPEGVLAAGVVSAPPRPIGENVARLLAARGGPDLQERIVAGIGRLAKAVGADEIVELTRALEAAFKLRRGFAAGSAPRGYERVISHDAPCGPFAAGAPLVDVEGRIVGIHVASAHYGTSYAVPIDIVRAAFGPKPGAGPAPRPRSPREAF